MMTVPLKSKLTVLRNSILVSRFMTLDFRETLRIQARVEFRDVQVKFRDTRNKKTNEIFPEFKKHEWKNAHRALTSVAFILGALLLRNGDSTEKLLYYKEYPFGLCALFPLFRTTTKFSNMMAISISIWAVMEQCAHHACTSACAQW